jgi:large subunit ribosomal protein L10
VATERKVRLVAELKELIESAEIAIATSYQGVPVGQQIELRTALSEAGVTFRVVKNTLLLRAAADAGLDQFAQLADGPTALAVHDDDPVAASRVLAEFIAAHPGTPIAIRNAVISGELVDAAYVGDLATVPPRDELIARIAGNLIGKVTELVGLLQATTRDFAGLIEARAVQLEAVD